MCVVLAVPYYNLVLAPTDLATNYGAQENHWLTTFEAGSTPKRVFHEAYANGNYDPSEFKYLHLDTSVWANAGDSSDGTPWSDRLRGFRDHHEEGRDFVGSAMQYKYFDEMYRYPYLAYLPYSLVLFGVIAMGLIFCVVAYTDQMYRIALLWLEAIAGSSSIKESRDELKSIANYIHTEIVTSLANYSIFLLVFLLFFCFEINLGFLTLAFTGKFLTVLAIAFLLFSGAGIVLFVLYRYNKEFTKSDLDQIKGIKKPFEIMNDLVLRLTWGPIIAIVSYLAFSKVPFLYSEYFL